MQLSASLWKGSLSAQDIVSKFATLVSGTLTLTFSSSNKVQVDQFDDLANLATWIEII